MRNLNELNKFRVKDPDALQFYGGWTGDETCGVFQVLSKIDHAILRIVASSGEGWDHVSVSRKNRCPNWAEMEQIKHLFFKENETAMQLHVPESEHINCHPYCLHIWRPTDQEIPKPPPIMVGPVKESAA